MKREVIIRLRIKTKEFTLIDNAVIKEAVQMANNISTVCNCEVTVFKPKIKSIK